MEREGGVSGEREMFRSRRGYLGEDIIKTQCIYVLNCQRIASVVAILGY